MIKRILPIALLLAPLGASAQTFNEDYISIAHIDTDYELTENQYTSTGALIGSEFLKESPKNVEFEVSKNFNGLVIQSAYTPSTDIDPRKLRSTLKVPMNFQYVMFYPRLDHITEFANEDMDSDSFHLRYGAELRATTGGGVDIVYGQLITDDTNEDRLLPEKYTYFETIYRAANFEVFLRYGEYKYEEGQFAMQGGSSVQNAHREESKIGVRIQF